jgi:transposase
LSRYQAAGLPLPAHGEYELPTLHDEDTGQYGGAPRRGRARRPAGARARPGHRDQATGEQIKRLTDQIATALREHPDGEIFLSLFRDPRGVVTAAELLAEIGDCRDRYPTGDTLAADAGQAAVAVEPGKRKTASFRWGCNKRLRGAFCTLADSTRHWHPWRRTATPPPVGSDAMPASWAEPRLPSRSAS